MECLNMPTTQNNKLHTLKEAAQYCDMSVPTFRHIFYNINQKQYPKPNYYGQKYVVKKVMGQVEKEVPTQTLLRFKQTDLDEFLDDGVRDAV